MSITLCIGSGLIFAEESKVLFHKTCRFVESICSPNYRCSVNCKLKIESLLLCVIFHQTQRSHKIAK